MSDSTFLGLPADIASDGLAPYAVLPVPLERTTSYGQGTRLGPQAILSASTQVDEFDDELCTVFDTPVQTLAPPEFQNKNHAAALEAIREAAIAATTPPRFLLSLGGEHSITGPLVEALGRTRGVQTVIQIDAHTDLRSRYEDSSLSHACVMRRILENGMQTVQLGCRSLCAEEADLIRDRDLSVQWARDIVTKGFDAAALDQRVKGPVYLSIDIDALDPAEAPGTGTPEPGGLSWYTLLGIVRHVIATHDVVGADIVEVAPIEGSVVTEFLAARLAVKLMLYHRLAARHADE